METNTKEEMRRYRKGKHEGNLYNKVVSILSYGVGYFWNEVHKSNSTMNRKS